MDAGCFSEGQTGWGLIIRNHRKEVILSACRKENIRVNPTLAEALGIKWGLQTAVDKNLQKVVIEYDAAEVVNCINRKSFLACIDNYCSGLLRYHESIR